SSASSYRTLAMMIETVARNTANETAAIAAPDRARYRSRSRMASLVASGAPRERGQPVHDEGREQGGGDLAADQAGDDDVPAVLPVPVPAARGEQQEEPADEEQDAGPQRAGDDLGRLDPLGDRRDHRDLAD